MAGVDPLTVKQLGGWKTLSMVQRYAHLQPAHLRDAVDRIAGRQEAAPRGNYPATSPTPLSSRRGRRLVYRKYRSFLGPEG